MPRRLPAFYFWMTWHLSDFVRRWALCVFVCVHCGNITICLSPCLSSRGSTQYTSQTAMSSLNHRSPGALWVNSQHYVLYWLGECTPGTVDPEQLHTQLNHADVHRCAVLRASGDWCYTHTHTHDQVKTSSHMGRCLCSTIWVTENSYACFLSTEWWHAASCWRLDMSGRSRHDITRWVRGKIKHHVGCFCI